MARITLCKHSPAEPGRAGRVRSSRGLKSWKRSGHRRLSPSGYSPHKREDYQPRPSNIRSGHGRKTRINERVQKASFRSFRDKEPPYYHNRDDVMDITSSEGTEEDFFWEEEQTLFSDLMEGADIKEYKGPGWTDLLESLQDAFTEHSVALKKETAGAFVPTVTRVKKILRACDEKDRTYGEGILMLNSTLKQYEITVIETEDSVKEACGSARNKINTILRKLEETYSQRDKIWAELHEKIAQIGDATEPVAQHFREVPATVERTIATQEKKSRSNEKNEGNSTLINEETVKELLKKL